MEKLIEPFAYSFMMRAFIVGLIVSLCSSLLGVVLVLKRYSMIGDGLSHAGFGILAVATALNIAPLYVSLFGVMLCACFIMLLNERSKFKGDALTALISTGALAVGILVSSFGRGSNIDLNSYLFGSILAMSRSDVVLSVALAAAVLILYLVFYNQLFAVTFDPVFARATGVRTGFFNSLLAVLTAVTVVLGMRMMGALLISSLIIFPALTAMRVCRRYRTVILVSALLSVSGFALGMTVSFLFATPAGASIVVVDILFYCIFAALGAARSR